jgi:hypothetical protein
MAGDIDCSGSVSSVDALLTLRHVAGMDAAGACGGSGDFDCDADTDAVDAVRILRFVASLSAAANCGNPGP